MFLSVSLCAVVLVWVPLAENLRGGCGRIHCGPVSWSKAHETNETVFSTCSLSTKRLQVAQVVLDLTWCLQFHFRCKRKYTSFSAWLEAFWVHWTLERLGCTRHNSTQSDTRYPRSFFSLCQTHNSWAWGAAGSDGRNQGECPGGLDYAMATFGYRVWRQVVPTLGSTSVSSGQASIFKTFWSARLSWVWHHRALHLRLRLEWWWHCVARPVLQTCFSFTVVALDFAFCDSWGKYRVHIGWQRGARSLYHFRFAKIAAYSPCWEDLGCFVSASGLSRRNLSGITVVLQLL